MAPPKPTDESIMDAIVTTLSAIVSGDAYHYTPGRVVRAELDEAVNFDALADPIIVLRPGEMRNELDATKHGESTDLEFVLTIAKRDTRLSTVPQLADSADPPAQLARARMTTDIRRALALAWPTWAYGVVSLVISDRDSDTFVKGWCVAHLRGRVKYRERVA